MQPAANKSPEEKRFGCAEKNLAPPVNRPVLPNREAWVNEQAVAPNRASFCGAKCTKDPSRKYDIPKFAKKLNSSNGEFSTSGSLTLKNNGSYSIENVSYCFYLVWNRIYLMFGES